MSQTAQQPGEGAIFVLSYTECDYDGEGTAALVFRLKEGRLHCLLGVLDLPDGVCWNVHSPQNYNRALEIIKTQQVTCVYTPLYTGQDMDFYGQTLGFFELSESLNENEEIECWFELGAFVSDWEFVRLLEENQIQVVNINPETKQLIE